MKNVEISINFIIFLMIIQIPIPHICTERIPSQFLDQNSKNSNIFLNYPATKKVWLPCEEVAYSAPEQWLVPPHTILSSKIEITTFFVL